MPGLGVGDPGVDHADHGPQLIGGDRDAVADGVEVDGGVEVTGAQLQEGVTLGGAMVSLQASEAEGADLVAGMGPGRVAVAAVNSPDAVVVSGEGEAVEALAARWRAAGRRTRRLRVSHAFHSPLVEPVVAELAEAAATVEHRRPTVPWVSTLTGDLVGGDGIVSQYWADQARHTVRFGDAVQTMAAQGVSTIIEVGPDGQLAALTADIVHATATENDATSSTSSGPAGSGDVLAGPTGSGSVGTGVVEGGRFGRGDGNGIVPVPVLRPGRDERGTFMSALAKVWVRGAPVDWRPVLHATDPQVVDLPTYPFQHQRFWPTPPPSVAASDLGTWLYRVRWKPFVRTPNGGGLTGRWLLVASEGVDDDVVPWCERALGDRGAEVVVLLVSPEAARGSVADQLSRAVGSGPVSGVLSLVGADEDPLPTKGVPTGLAGTLVVVQALGDAGIGAPLWCATRRGVLADESDPPASLAQAQVWGLGRVVGLESPHRWGGLVDLPPVLDDGTADQLGAVLAQTGAEDQAALRPAGTLIPRLVRATAEPATTTTTTATFGAGLTTTAGAADATPTPTGAWAARGTALVTGGTGALGAHVARWLATAGAKHIVLVSRRGPEAPGAAGLVAELEALGAEPTVVACDVVDREALAEVLRTVPADRPLRTIVHAAGASVSGEVAAMSVADLAVASAAKAMGAWHLHQLTLHQDLDAFVLFSSGAAIWGGGGQGAYAAANAAVDALAAQRRAQGRAATSVAWGPWSGGGMAAEAGAIGTPYSAPVDSADGSAGDLRGKARPVDRPLASGPVHTAEGSAEGQGTTTGEQLRRRGVRTLPPELAIRALQQVLDRGDSAVAIADLDWPRFAPSFAAARRRPLIEDIPEVAQLAEPSDDAMLEGATELVDRLARLSPEERHPAVVELVRAEVALVLGHDGPAAVELDRAFKDLGFDSVTAVELRNRLGELTGLRLPATLVFDHPTPAALGHEVAHRLTPARRSADEEALDHLARVEAALGDLAGDDPARAAVTARIRRLLSRLTTSDGAGSEDRQVEDALHAADDETLLAFIDRQLDP